MRPWVIGAALGIFGVQALALFAMGQPAICECGYIKAWEGAVLSSGNSQHLTDWYTFSHIVHGIVFFYVLGFLFPRLSLPLRFLIALGIEAGWELFENTPMIIEHYRQQALAQGYTGDSILNSAVDSLAMVLGFIFARRAPVLIVVGAVIGMEVFVAYSIRDNLVLNILNLIHQFPAIEVWQAGG